MIEHCLVEREARVKVSKLAEAVDLNLAFHAAVVAACHNPLLQQLNQATRHPLRTALCYTTGLRAADLVDVAAHRKLFEAIRQHDPAKARTASDRIVGLAMLSVENALHSKTKGNTKHD